ncbi:DUF3347 domain-containing protein [Flavobacterium sp. AED]|uniref:DUF3347 domain-containing protein n=1 Tax=Flavobacterium sp. AED TaxID=1423323 RepID=UPI00057DB803|nr:DUF3347 domain-containing protein [Flavobacterium sp. AED]KIA87363.1 cobalt transporter [Flavobacterium sp. AED]
MKNIILSSIACTFLFIACNPKNKQAETINTETAKSSSELYACSMHPEITGKKGEACSKCGMELTEPVAKIPKTETKITTIVRPEAETKPVISSSFAIDEIVSSYLKLKNALIKDDSKAAANATKSIVVALNEAGTNTLDAKLKKKYNDIAADAKEHAKLIGNTVGKIDQQRAHFAMLSKDVNDLIKTFGTKQKLYQDYCPMYDEGKSGYWISEIKEIRNPYYGSEMLSCGRIEKMIQ